MGDGDILPGLVTFVFTDDTCSTGPILASSDEGASADVNNNGQKDAWEPSIFLTPEDLAITVAFFEAQALGSLEFDFLQKGLVNPVIDFPIGLTNEITLITPAGASQLQGGSEEIIITRNLLRLRNAQSAGGGMKARLRPSFQQDRLPGDPGPECAWTAGGRLPLPLPGSTGCRDALDTACGCLRVEARTRRKRTLSAPRQKIGLNRNEKKDLE